jgi:hypothetical protein
MLATADHTLTQVGILRAALMTQAVADLSQRPMEYEAHR